MNNSPTLSIVPSLGSSTETGLPSETSTTIPSHMPTLEPSLLPRVETDAAFLAEPIVEPRFEGAFQRQAHRCLPTRAPSREC